MDKLPSLKALSVFLAAGNSESFKLAAESLFVTQAAVSQQIRLLEKELGVALFERHGGKTTLSHHGEVLLPFIDEGFLKFHQGVYALSQSKHNNELKVTALHSVTSLILIPNIDSFMASYSDVKIQFSPNNMLDDLITSDLDVAIRRGLGQYPGLESHKLVDDEIVLIASPLFIENNKSCITQLPQIPLLEDTSSDIQEAIDDFVTLHNLKRDKFDSRIRTSDSLPVIQGALSGKGVAFVSRVLVNEYLNQGSLTNLMDYSFSSELTLYLVAPKENFALDKVVAFENWLKVILAN